MTKQMHEESTKTILGIEDVKVELAPKLIDSSIVVGGAPMIAKPRGKTKGRTVRNKMVKRLSRLEKATSMLYDLEDAKEPEKHLDIDLSLYQMEDY